MNSSLMLAVEELNLINAHQDPKFKLCCIRKCIEFCLNGIVLGTGEQSPGADSLVPVLVLIYT